MIFEMSCGAVVFFNSGEEILYLIVKQNKKSGGHWGFSKGKVEKKEHEIETAKREIFEETGIWVEFINGFKEQVEYTCKGNVCKTVIYFLGKANTTKTKTQFNELDDSRFVNFVEATKLLTYESSKRILNLANNYIIDNILTQD